MKVKLNVTGMTCAACSARVEKAAKNTPGVESAEVNLLSGTLQAQVDNLEAVACMIAAVEKAVYGAFEPGK